MFKAIIQLLCQLQRIFDHGFGRESSYILGFEFYFISRHLYSWLNIQPSFYVHNSIFCHINSSLLTAVSQNWFPTRLSRHSFQACQLLISQFSKFVALLFKSGKAHLCKGFFHIKHISQKVWRSQCLALLFPIPVTF